MHNTPTSAPAGERLDSWKEISAYLKRDPRTLQRWEKKEGLPVHRHVHESQVSIYAYTGELDAWLASRTRSNGNGAAAAASVPAFRRRLLWVGLASVVILGGVIAAVLLRRGAAVAPVSPTYRQVWRADQVDYWNGISPSGRYYSYTDLDTGNLCVRDLNSGTNQRLTNKGKPASRESPAWAYNAAFSPDEKSIAYWWSADDRASEVHVIGLDGRGDRRLIRDPGRASYIIMDWSPDGKFIAAVIQTSYHEAVLALISPRDGSAKVLKRFGLVSIQRAAFSKDSRYLAYDAAGADGNGDIFIIDVDGTRDERVIAYPTDEFLAGWSPKGDSLIFGSDRTGRPGMWRIAIQQGKVRGEPQLLKDDVGSVLPLGVTRSGSIFTLLDVGLVDVFIGELGSKDPPVRISERFIGARTNPSFSPDGRSLLYQASRGSAGGALYIRSLESGAERAIHPHLADFGFPVWMEGGRAIEVSGSDGQKDGLWRVDPDTGSASLIQEGARPPVYRPPAGMRGPGGPVLAPNGSAYVLAVRNNPKGYNSLMLVPAAGGEARELVRLKQPEGFLGGFAWSPDSRCVYFPRHNSAGTDLLRIAASGGAIEPTGLHMPTIKNVSVHPDGKRVAFQSGDPDLELWALDGFLTR